MEIMEITGKYIDKGVQNINEHFVKITNDRNIYFIYGSKVTLNKHLIKGVHYIKLLLNKKLIIKHNEICTNKKDTIIEIVYGGPLELYGNPKNFGLYLENT